MVRRHPARKFPPGEIPHLTTSCNSYPGVFSLRQHCVCAPSPSPPLNFQPLLILLCIITLDDSSQTSTQRRKRKVNDFPWPPPESSPLPSSELSPPSNPPEYHHSPWFLESQIFYLVEEGRHLQVDALVCRRFLHVRNLWGKNLKQLVRERETRWTDSRPSFRIKFWIDCK